MDCCVYGCIAGMFGGGGAGLWFIEGVGKGRDRVVLAVGTAFLMVPTDD
jgi:hypothetical protein